MTQYLDKVGLATFKELADKAYVHNEAEAITSELYAKESIYGDHIYKGTIWGYHIHNSTISAKNLMRESVETEKNKGWSSDRAEIGWLCLYCYNKTHKYQ